MSSLATSCVGVDLEILDAMAHCRLSWLKEIVSFSDVAG
jgi:hypothetical protein